MPRRVAAFLLQSAISIAPRDTLDWAHAMLAELCHMQGNWAALLWSLGSASVLAKHALLSLIFPNRNRPTIPSDGALFSKDGPMRRPALAITAACVHHAVSDQRKGKSCPVFASGVSCWKQRYRRRPVTRSSFGAGS